jgi:molybdopterin-guanine dinucleotide biosynthesis protein A
MLHYHYRHEQVQSLTSAIILAGGRGERLAGQDKAATLLDGETLLKRVHRRVAALADDVVIVLRPDQELAPALVEAVANATVVRDLPGYSGVLAGMAAGLEAARHEWSLLVACDMPFIHASLVRYMWSLREGWDIVVPRLEVGLEPLHALYHRGCLPSIRDALAQRRQRVISFYEPLRVRYVGESEIDHHDPRRLSFFNINTPEDLARARELLADDA